ncbi:chromosome associated protein H2 isoform X2 [Haematobia irritans]|uniref:chromosome associated protein H2 isoform X2 n=1 Tax=Haematobia irritans TaxID=7368 RepID=UPI003F4F5B18
MDNIAGALNDILRAADKHPNSRVAKLIRTVEEDQSQKNIVLLLIELADHAEFATDFNISLSYYLDLFERLGIDKDLILNEAGLLLVNSSKIYSKRVDYVQSLVEKQICTLSNADKEIQQQKEQNENEETSETTTPAEKPKRGRKRALDTPTDPYEVQLEPKKFKKMTPEKRFALPKTPTKIKSLPRNIEVEQQIHPASYMYATIYDLENEEEVDTKRNYKLFTYQVEHRYNTLVPDINFRLHFKVKDYIDAQEEADEESNDGYYNRNKEWPTLSEEYVQKYISLENHVLQLEIDPTKSWEPSEKTKNVPLNVTGSDDLQNVNTSLVNDTSAINDSGMGTSILESSLDITQKDSTTSETSSSNATVVGEIADKTVNDTLNNTNDSALGDSILDQTNPSNETTLELNRNEETSENDQVDKEAISTDDSALGNSILNQTNPSNETTLELNRNEETSENDKVDKEISLTSENVAISTENTDLEKCLAPKESEDVNAEKKDQTETQENGDKEKSDDVPVVEDEIPNEENGNDGNCNEDTNGNIANEKDPDSTKETTGDTFENSEVVVEAAIEPKNAMVQSDSTSDNIQTTMENSLTENEAKETEKTATELTTANEEEICINENLSKDKHVPNENTLNDKDDFLELEIHVMSDNENEPSERLHVQISTTDDEGVHLSDVFEGDLQMLSPVIANNSNKDFTILMDDKLREALANGEMDNCTQETYNVPVIQQPKEYPILLNVLQIPPKLLKRKILFKLGPEMDLYLKARCLKPTRPVAPIKEYRLSKQMQFFALNNSDMSGIIDTPPNSPGHQSDFYGFSDEEMLQDDDTMCSEFCGFNEEEPNRIPITPHRLSRDSGVGVDGAILTPEKEPLEVIFEENSLDVNKCKVNLNDELTKAQDMQTTDEILSDLPDSIRTALEAEIQDVITTDVTNGDTEMTSTISLQVIEEKDNSKESCNNGVLGTTDEDKSEESIIEPTEDKDDEIDTNTKGDENNETPLDKEMTNETSTTGNNSTNTSERENAEDKLEEKTIADVNNTETSHLNQSLNNDYLEDDTVPLDIATIFEDNSQQENELFDLNLHGAKTKIQQWHEHLRPILAKSRERHHFDVFQLGTEIIDTIQATHTGGETTFNDIMHDKDKSYVSRYFLSTLLLANQSNVNISVNNKSSESPSDWSDIGLKLLSTKRHTVAIEDNIGMVHNKKRKQDIETVEHETKKTKKKMIVVDEDEDEDEPLVLLQKSSKPKVKRSATISPTKHLKEKKFKGEPTTSTPQIKNTKDLQIISQEYLPPLAAEVPSTSRQANQANITQPEILEHDHCITNHVHKKSPDSAIA